MNGIQNHVASLHSPQRAAVSHPVEPVPRPDAVPAFRAQASGPPAIVTISSQAANAAEASGAAATVQHFVRSAGDDPAADANHAVSPEHAAFGARGGANAVAKAYQAWSARGAGAAPTSGAEHASDVEASRAAAPAETQQATRAAAAAYRAAGTYGANGSYSTSSSTAAAELQLPRARSSAFANRIVA